MSTAAAAAYILHTYTRESLSCLDANHVLPPRMLQLPKYLARHPSLLKEFTEWKDNEGLPDQPRVYVFMTKEKRWTFDSTGKGFAPEGEVSRTEEEVRHVGDSCTLYLLTDRRVRRV